jgi:hypothetical protein
MTQPDVSDPDYWSRRASAVRQLAATFEDIGVRMNLERLAKAYEELADISRQLAGEVNSN